MMHSQLYLSGQVAGSPELGQTKKGKLWVRLLLECIYAVLKEWHRQGKQRTPETRHDFRQRCQTLDWIIQEIFGLSPFDGHREEQRRISNPDLTWLREVALCVEIDDRLGEGLKPNEIAELCENQVNFAVSLRSLQAILSSPPCARLSHRERYAFCDFAAGGDENVNSVKPDSQHSRFGVTTEGQASR